MQILTGDAFEMLQTLPDESVNCCVTSPPYYGLRDYGGIEKQIGLEETPAQYVERLVKVFQQVKRVLRSDGTLWLNLGDSYCSQGGPQVVNTINSSRIGGSDTQNAGESRKPFEGYKPKDLMGIPWRVAFALQDDGWYLRQDIIWHKRNPMPESVTDRCTRAHEYIFLLSKSSRYFYNHEAIKQPVAESTIGRGKVDFGGKKGREYIPEPSDPNFRNGSEQWGRTFDYAVSCKNGANRRDVWAFSSKPFPGAHFATFPPELPEICIKAGCPEGGTVLDPFHGAGTTWLVSKRLNRKYIGIDINPEYIELSKNRVYNDAPLFNMEVFASTQGAA